MLYPSQYDIPIRDIRIASAPFFMTATSHFCRDLILVVLFTSYKEKCSKSTRTLKTTGRLEYIGCYVIKADVLEMV